MTPERLIFLEQGFYLTLSLLIGALVALGLMRVNLLNLFIAFEISLAALGVNFLIVAQYYGAVQGQIMALTLLVTSAVELSIGLALLVVLYHIHGRQTIDCCTRLRG